MFGQPSVDSLLEHVGFLRGLARRLVFDHGQAEDVVQEALVIALRNQPKHPSRLRGWLAGITRNLALKRLRTQGRRRARERAVARPEALASTADIVSRLDLQRRVVQEVMELDEPYRSTLVYRYFDELSARETAQVMSVPVKTIETRLRRGVLQLRQRMDGAHGHNRKAWVLGLAALVPSILTKEGYAAATATAVAGGSGAGFVPGIAVGTKATAVVVAGLVATSFLVGRSGSGQEAARAPQRVATQRTLPTDDGTLDRLLGELESERARRIELELQIASEGRTTWTPWDEIASRAPRTPRVAVGPRFLYKGFDRALRAIDWEIVSESLLQMPRLLAETIDARLKKADAPDSGSEIHRFNGPFMAEVLKLRRNGIDGAKLNNVWTHPAVLVNMIHATLQRAQRPLSEAQQSTLGRIGSDFVEQDRRRLDGYAEDALALQRLLDETALKDRFFAEVDTLLDASQRTVLHPAVQRGYTNSDLFSSAIIWGAHAHAMGVKDHAGLIDRYVEGLCRAFEVDESLVTPIVERGAARMQDVLLAEPYDVAARNRHMRVERVREFAEMGLALRKEILAQLPLTTDQRAKVREDSLVPVPYRIGD